MTVDKRSALGLFLPAVIALPPLVGLGYAVTASFGLIGVAPGGATSRYLREVIASHTTWAGLGWTLWITTASTFLATLAAVLLGGVNRRAAAAEWVELKYPIVQHLHCRSVSITENAWFIQ